MESSPPLSMGSPTESNPRKKSWKSAKRPWFSQSARPMDLVPLRLATLVFPVGNLAALLVHVRSSGVPLFSFTKDPGIPPRPHSTPNSRTGHWYIVHGRSFSCSPASDAASDRCAEGKKPPQEIQAAGHGHGRRFTPVAPFWPRPPYIDPFSPPGQTVSGMIHDTRCRQRQKTMRTL